MVSTYQFVPEKPAFKAPPLPVVPVQIKLPLEAFCRLKTEVPGEVQLVRALKLPISLVASCRNSCELEAKWSEPR